MKLTNSLAIVGCLVVLCSGTSHAVETWKQLLERADSLSTAQNQDSAIVVARIALGSAQAESGSEDSTVARVLQSLGKFYLLKADFVQADSLMRRALLIQEQVLDSFHVDIAVTLSGLASVSRRLGKSDEAESLHRRAQLIRETTLGPQSPEAAQSIHNLAIICTEQGRYAEAEELHTRALAIREMALGPDHLDVANSLNNVGTLYSDQARYAEAEPFLMRALAIREEALGTDHPDVANSLNNIAILYSDQARYAEAESLYRRALAIQERAYGENHPFVAIALSNLANTCVRLGHYAEAEPLHRRALDIDEKALGPDQPEVASDLSNLATAYSAQRRYADAEPLFKRAAAIIEKVLGPDHPDLAYTLNNLGLVYYNLGRYVDAEPLFKRAIAIDEKALGSDHPYLASDLHNLALVYEKQALYVDAELIYMKALAINEAALGPEHPMVSANLGGLANTYVKQGRFAEAELLLRRGLTIDEKILGPQHPEVAITLGCIATSRRAAQQPGLGIGEAKRAFAIVLGSFRSNVTVMSEEDALTYSGIVREASGAYLSSHMEGGALSREQVDDGCTIVLESKGIVSDGIMERQRALATEKDSVTLALVESVRSTRYRISQLHASGPGDDTTGTYKRELDSLSQASNELEGVLYRHSASFKRRQEFNNVTVARVGSALPANTTLVEYLKWDYHQLNPDSLIPRYLALVMDKEKGPEIVNLGETSELDPLIGKYLNHMQGLARQGRFPSAVDMADYRPISQAIFNKIWKPLEKHFSANQTILIGLDGALNLLSLGSLLDSKGTYLAERYALHYISSGRDLLRLDGKTQSGHGLFALGDPDFDASIVERTNRSSEQLLAIAEGVGSELAMRNVRSGCGILSDLQVSGLPFTRAEVREVSALWPGRGRDSAEVLYGAQASEDAFKAHSPGRRTIHLATHGYYLTGQCGPQMTNRRRVGSDEGFVGENPLLLSGLLFAGSNLHGTGCDSAHCEDGILSASEVAGMDLTGTDLVVLSACETGLGEVKAGEGVYGLRRAFQMAGARTVVSALWPVSDQITAEMMGRLYNKSSGQSLSERMRQMQMEQLNKLRQAELPDHPFLWAGFIATGDWR